jgi:TolB-like protein
MRISLLRSNLTNRSAKLFNFYMVGLGLSLFCVWTPNGRAAEAFDFQLAMIIDKIADAVSKANLKAVTVAGFTDLHDNDSDLGLFLADQLAAGLVQKNCVVVDRRNVAKILAEHKLTTSGLVDPENAKKLGQFAGVDAIVIGTVTPLSGTIRLTVEVLATDSAKVLAAASADIPKTNSIRDVMGENEIPEPSPTTPVRKNEIVQPQAPTVDPRIDVLAFVKESWSHNESNDSGDWASDFADHVRYCYSDSGFADRGFIRFDRAKLVDKYPVRHYTFFGPDIQMNGSNNSARVTYSFAYSYAGRNSVAGFSRVSLTVQNISGRWFISDYDERVDRH